MSQASNQAVGYCRVSSTRQVEGTSLESQERLIREYAKREGLTLKRMFIERGESAKTADRTQFNKAIAFSKAKKNNVGYFVVYKLDRFARSQIDHMTVRSALKRSGVQLRSVTEPINETPVGKAMEGMISVFAEFDNNVRTERTKQGMMERLNAGIWVWPAPIGYHRLPGEKNISPDPKTAPFVRMAFEEYGKGVYTYKELSKLLADKGLKTPSGRKPSFQLIKKMLSNPIYYGYIRSWGGFEGSFAPIISKDLFESCQKPQDVSKAAHAAPRSVNNPLFPLRKLVVCQQCGKPYTGSVTKGRRGGRYPYYHHYSPGCPNNSWIPKAKFEKLFTDLLEEITPSEEYLGLLKAEILDCWRKSSKQLDKQNANIRKQLEKLERERQRVFELHRKGVYDDEEFLEQKGVVARMMIEKRGQFVETGLCEEELEECMTHCFQYVKATAPTWINLKNAFEKRLHFQRMIFKDSIPFDGERFRTPDLSLIYAINQESKGDKSTVVTLCRTSWEQVILQMQTNAALFLQAPV